MSKFESPSTNLVSKDQLKADRYHTWKSKITKVGLYADCQQWWSAADKSAESAIWAECDAEYEADKAALKAKIAKLSAGDQAKYFAEIGVAQPSSLDEYLPAKG